MSFSQDGLALVSGALSTLSPCVLPVLPVIVSSAVAAHGLGIWALGAGLILSFTSTGMLLATLGVSVGLDQNTVRSLAAGMLIVFALILLVPSVGRRFSFAASSFSGKTNALLQRVSGESWHGQFLIGVLLGAAWTPCAGPTLGTAVAVASQGKDMVHAALIMLFFAIGAAIPLFLVGVLSREALHHSHHLKRLAVWGRYALGTVILLIGLGTLTGYDHVTESWLMARSPQWLITLTTQY